MGYCDFNPRLFKEFVSKGTKIKPQMADDWEMIPTAHVKIGGFSLKSTKLNQEVADISLMRFLKFCKMENLVIEGLKLKGNFIIGNDRSVYTEKTYGKWKNKFESRTETIIDKKDYIAGHKYKTPCGAELIYLGFKYVSKLKDRDDYSKKTKVTKKYFVTSKNKYSSSMSVSELTQKFTIDLGSELSVEKVDTAMQTHYDTNMDIVCWEDKKPKIEEYELIEVPKISVISLLVESQDELYANNYGFNFKRHSNTFTNMPTYNRESGMLSGGYDYRRNNEKKIDKMLRINIKG